MLALSWHNVPAYYALNYAGIFDGGLPATLAELNDKDFCFFVTLSALDVLHTLMLDILDDTNGLLTTAFIVLVAA